MNTYFETLAREIRGNTDRKLLSLFELGVLAWRNDLAVRSDAKRMPTRSPDKLDGPYLRRTIRRMVESSVLFEIRGMPRTTYATVAPQSVSDLALLCQADPSSFASFATAMEIYGFSNRIPKMYFMQTLNQQDWSAEAKSRVGKELGEFLDGYLQMEMPLLTRSNPKRVRSSNVQWIRTKRAHSGWRWIDDRSIRVATVGRLFLDMLQHPEYCGGIRHVIEVFSDYAAQYLPAILAEYEAHANNIDKVRAGYILEEHCGVRSDVVSSWTRFATRGGGQKLDASSAYAPVFSERWMLSLNVQ